MVLFGQFLPLLRLISGFHFFHFPMTKNRLLSFKPPKGEAYFKHVFEMCNEDQSWPPPSVTNVTLFFKASLTVTEWQTDKHNLDFWNERCHWIQCPASIVCAVVLFCVLCRRLTLDTRFSDISRARNLSCERWWYYFDDLFSYWSVSTFI